jgi:hypothetical protein
MFSNEYLTVQTRATAVARPSVGQVHTNRRGYDQFREQIRCRALKLFQYSRHGICRFGSGEAGRSPRTESHTSVPPMRSGRKVLRYDSLDDRCRGHLSNGRHGADVASCSDSRRSLPSSPTWSARRSPPLSHGIGFHLGRSRAPAERVPPDGYGHHCRRCSRRTR